MCAEISDQFATASQQQTFAGASPAQSQPRVATNNSTSGADSFNVASFLDSFENKTPVAFELINSLVPSQAYGCIPDISSMMRLPTTAGDSLHQMLDTAATNVTLLAATSDYPYGHSNEHNGCSSFADLPFMDWVDAATDFTTSSDSSLLPSLVSRFITATPSTDDTSNASSSSSSTFDDDDFLISEFLNLPHEICSAAKLASLDTAATTSSHALSTGLDSMIPTACSDFDWCC